MTRTAAATLLACLLAAACQSAAEQATSLRQAQDAQANLTLGRVQQAIHVGMSGADVTESLGAPNMVTTDEQRREVWVYDRVASEKAASASAGGVGILVAGFGGGASASSSSQRTLTVIVKFDDAGKVRDFSYRSSSF